MAVPVIYLSAAQADLRTHLLTARAVLEAEGLQVVEYEIRDATGWSPVRHGMRTRLRGCQAMVHLAGTCFGAEPNAVPAGAVRRSYAQMEYHLASDLHIPCYSIVLSEDFPFDPHKPEDEEAQRLQQQHRATLTQGLSGMDTVHDPGDLQWSLEALASRIRMSHASAPRRKARAAWLIFAPLVLVALAAAAFHFLGLQLPGRKQPIPVQTAAPPANEVAPVLDAESMKRVRSMIGNVAAAAVIAGLPAEQQDPITKTELAMDEVARDRGMTALEAKLELERFAHAVGNAPDSDAKDKALAAFTEGNYQSAADLASAASPAKDDDEEEEEEAGKNSETFATLLLNGHLQYLAGQQEAAVTSYKAALEKIDRSQSPQDWLDAAIIAAVAMTQRAQWEEASQLLTDILIHIDTHPQTDAQVHARALQAMASLEVSRGRSGVAENLLQKACKLLEAGSGSGKNQNSDALATATVALGEVLCVEGKRDDAEGAFRRAVAMLEQQYGEDSPEVARVLGSLATMLADSGRPAHAIGLSQRALAINEQRFGPTHPRVARDLMQLAAFSAPTGESSENRDADLCRRAVEIYAGAFGPRHPATALAMSNLASALNDEASASEAESLARDAVGINVNTLGAEHPATLRAMKVLARAMNSAGNKDEAINLHRSVVAATERKYGPDNAETARALADLAGALGENGRYHDAEPLYRRALSIVERQFGPDDFRVFLGVRNLAGVLRDAGNKEQALELFRRALEIARRNLSADDPGLVVELGNVGSALRSLGRYTDAETVFREALAIQEKSMPPDDPAMAETLSNLAGVLFLSGRHTEAEPVYRRVLEVLASASRESRQPHPNLELARKNYHADLKRMGLNDDEITKRIEKVEAGEAVKDLTAVSVP